MELIKYLPLQQRYKYSFVFNKLSSLPLRLMKFFAFIMAFLVLALSVMPCADSGGAKDSKAKTEITKASQQPSHDDTDECSPFCHCTCCAGFSINHTSTAITAIHSFSNDPKSSFLPSNVIEVALPIWQPPRLV